MPRVINSLRGVHTYKYTNTHTYRHSHRNKFKKPGVHWPEAGTCLISKLEFKKGSRDHNKSMEISKQLEPVTDKK